MFRNDVAHVRLEVLLRSVLPVIERYEAVRESGEGLVYLKLESADDALTAVLTLKGSSEFGQQRPVMARLLPLALFENKFD